MNSEEKIKPRKEVAAIVDEMRSQGKKAGLTNGVFDILHAGHVQYLEQARSRCDALIVSLNTDESVQLYKDPGRPIVSQEQRARVIAGLQCIDYVTFHNERRMRKSLEIIRPHYYIKGGDYKPEQLTSRDVVEAYGGEILILPLTPGISTSEIIDRISKSYSLKPQSCEVSNPEPAPAVFLDRDGVINVDKGYVSEPQDFEFLPGAIEGLKRFNEAGWFIIIVTNQGGIGMGYYSREDFFRVNLEMLKGLSNEDILVHKIYFCPHSKSEKCPCRKPSPGMLERGMKELPVLREKSVMIGDKITDIQAGKAAGVKTCFIRGASDSEVQIDSDYNARNLLDASEMILGRMKG